MATLLIVLAVAAGAIWLLAAVGGTTGQPTSGATTTTASTTTASTATNAPGPPLAGKVVGIDPGHNGDNYANPSIIDAPVFNGRADEPCDTTGTATDGGYSEASFTFNVAQYLAADLRAEGAQVVLTRNSNTGVGLCVTQRSAIIANAHADAAVDIHADGRPPAGRGFSVLEPVAVGPNDGIVASSAVLARDVRDAFAAGTGMPVSTYLGTGGLEQRDDLAGLNLATQPKVLIECGNMRNDTDAALLVTPAFQQAAAASLARALTTFLVGT